MENSEKEKEKEKDKEKSQVSTPSNVNKPVILREGFSGSNRGFVILSFFAIIAALIYRHYYR